MPSAPAPTTFTCPNCEHVLPTGVAACSECNLRLLGPDAVRLWQVNQHIAALRTEADGLIQRLLRPAPDLGPVAGHVSAPEMSTVPIGRPMSQPAPKKSLTGQQLLLGLGALMLLSGASFFLLIVWLVVGVAGQAAIMVALTGTAVVGSVAATKRNLPAAAETAAVIATGLLLIDLAAAHSLGLAGLDTMPTDQYWAQASLFAGVMLLAWHKTLPIRNRAGDPARPIATYRPAAATMFGFLPWLVLAVASPEGLWLVVGLAAVAIVSGIFAAVAATFDTTRTGSTLRWTPATLILAASTLAAFLAHLVAGLTTGYDITEPTADRYGSMLILAVLPLTLAVLSTRAGNRFQVVEPHRPALPIPATVLGLVVTGIALLDVSVAGLVVLSLIAAAVVTNHALRPHRPTTDVRAMWRRCAYATACAAQPFLWIAVFGVTESNWSTIGQTWAVLESGPTPVTWWVSVIPGLAWAIPAGIIAARTRSATWVPVAHVATAVTLISALLHATTLVVLAGTFTAFLACTALACLAARRINTTPVGEKHGLKAAWVTVDTISIIFGALYAATATITAFFETSTTMSWTLIGIGVTTLVYAASPNRLGFAYLGSVVISVGTGIRTFDAEVGAVEAYALPLAALFAGIGFVQWYRNHDLPTRLTMQPALTVAIGPSLAVGLTEGDSLRLTAVTVVAIVALVVGLTRKWKAPVTVGSLALILVAVTQGGPLVSYVPGWVLLGAGGLTLLIVGLSWEQAVVTGRRANTWFSALK